MPKERIRRFKSLTTELLCKARESALSAIKIFNDPLIHFKSESFIVLMIIAWTYLLHAYYRSKGIDYRYYELKGKRKKYDRTKKGAYKHWELERCLNEDVCPLDSDTKNNLRFLIGVRHEIEHQMTLKLDDYLSGRYQACAINFNSHAKKLFGPQYSIDKYLTYSLQFIEVTEEQLAKKGGIPIPQNLIQFIEEFDGKLTHEEYNSSNFSYRLLFKRKLVNRPGQADKVVEFIDPKSELAKTIDKEFWVKKEVEKPKYLPSDVIKSVNNAGFHKYRMHEHTMMWKSEDAKNPSKGFGTIVRNSWYWYENWIQRCIELCQQAGEQYK